MATANNPVNNGVNVDALLGAREALTKAPAAAKFTWRATCKWVSGTHSRSTVQGFYGLGEEQKHKTEFTFDADHPEVFASEDKGATPVELVLTGLASCHTAGIASVAQLRKIQLRSESAYRNDIQFRPVKACSVSINWQRPDQVNESTLPVN